MKKQIVVGLVLLIAAAGIFGLYKALDKDKLFTAMDVPAFELTNQERK